MMTRHHQHEQPVRVGSVCCYASSVCCYASIHASHGYRVPRRARGGVGTAPTRPGRSTPRARDTRCIYYYTTRATCALRCTLVVAWCYPYCSASYQHGTASSPAPLVLLVMMMLTSVMWTVMRSVVLGWSAHHNHTTCACASCSLRVYHGTPRGVLCN